MRNKATFIFCFVWVVYAFCFYVNCTIVEGIALSFQLVTATGWNNVIADRLLLWEYLATPSCILKRNIVSFAFFQLRSLQINWKTRGSHRVQFMSSILTLTSSFFLRRIGFCFYSFTTMCWQTNNKGLHQKGQTFPYRQGNTGVVIEGNNSMFKSY